MQKTRKVWLSIGINTSGSPACRDRAERGSPYIIIQKNVLAVTTPIQPLMLKNFKIIEQPL